MDADLLAMWHDINTEHFAGRLTPPADIDWHPLTQTGDSLEAFGLYLPFAQSIAIDTRFKFDSNLIKQGDERENAKLEVAYRLVVHEMLHQLQYQLRLKRPGGHGETFIKEAVSVAQSLGIPPPTKGDAGAWPDIMPLLAKHKI